MIYALCFATDLTKGDPKIENWFGRPKKLSNEQKELILQLREEGKSVTELAKTFNVDRSTIYRLSNV